MTKMNMDNLSQFLTICRTCLHTKANHPIFADETNAASYSEMFFTVTGVKVEKGDSLPQNICQNCLNNVNNSVNFRKQCKEAETQLIIMESKAVSNKYTEKIKLEIDSNEKVSEMHNIESQNSSFVSIELNAKIKDENSQSMAKNINNKQEHFNNDKNTPMKIDSTKVFIQSTDKLRYNDEIKTVLCKLCKKTIAKRKFHAHVARKHNPTMERNVMCSICNIYLNKRQLIKHINKIHTKNHIGKSLNSIVNRKKITRVNKVEEVPSINDSLNKSLNLDNDRLCSTKQNNNTFMNESLDTEVVNFCNDKSIKVKLDEHFLTDNILYNYNDTVSKRVTCKLCQKDLSIRSVDSHMARHHPGADKRRIKCDLCDNYVLKSKLKRHTTIIHDSGFLCRYCKNKFDNKEQLVEHITNCNHKKKRRICDSSRELRQCDECDKTMQKGSLRLHKATKHAGLRPACEHCGRTFGNKLRLQDHYRAKHGYEKFKCSCCDFQSACATSMKNHERRHRGEKPFLCEACGAGFHAAYLLSQHRQSHAQDKTYQCDLCPASFKVNNTLHMHKRSCHSTSQYACMLCARTFRTRHYVIKHMRAVHHFAGPVPPMQPVQPK